MLFTGITVKAGRNDICEFGFSTKAKRNEVIDGNLIGRPAISTSVLESFKNGSPLRSSQFAAKFFGLSSSLLSDQTGTALRGLSVFFVLFSFPFAVGRIVFPSLCQIGSSVIGSLFSEFHCGFRIGGGYFASTCILPAQYSFSTSRNLVIALLAMSFVSAAAARITEKRIGEWEFLMTASA